MGCRALVVAVFIACAWPATAAAAGPPPGLHGALRLEMLSGPAQYVSGGAARVRVVVPASVPLAAATVTLNGADVTSSFAPDDRAPHALEGVLRAAARPEHRRGDRAGPGHSANDRATLTLMNYPITGPMFPGPSSRTSSARPPRTSPASTSPARSSTRTARCRRGSTTTTARRTRRGSRTTRRCRARPT